MLPLIPDILLARFNDRPLLEICAMGGITLEDFSQNRADWMIFGLADLPTMKLPRWPHPCSL